MTETGLHIRLLGGVGLALQGKILTGLPTRKAEALLIYLACHQRSFPREQMAELLWDDRPQDQALANLRSILSGMRRKLKPYLTITRQSVAFNHDSDYWLDTAVFRRGIENWQAETLDAPAPTKYPKAPLTTAHLHDLEEALTLYRGDFLSGFYLRESRGFEEWATLERERFRRQAMLGLHQLASYYLQEGQFYLAVRTARRLVQLDELNEEAHRQLMLALARNGELGAALAQYRACRQKLAAELEVAPAAETSALHERLRAAYSTPRHNLPPPPTPFVGRLDELNAVQSQLTNPDCRLLTILGSGGMGKTRLALAAAAGMVETGLFLNGIRFASLANVTNPRLLPAALADSLNLTFQGSEAPVDQIISHLENQELLLVLDNMEQLLDEDEAVRSIDLVNRILRSTPQITLLVTSRQRLHLQEEWVFDVAGLAAPPAGSDAKTAAQYSAVQLFLQTARRVQRHFHPTPADFAAIVDICHLLEGMPLGIELSAAGIRQFSAADMAQQLREKYDFLATQLRNMPARHRSITAVFDHSWQLLNPEAQAIFARLAVFSGSFTTDAAAAVCGTKTAVLDTFVSRSLLHRHEDQYDMHPLLRQYAGARLADTPARQDETHRRHAAFYLDLLTKVDRVEYGDQRKILHQALPNIRTAWEWTARHQDERMVAQVAPALHSFYSVSSRFHEGIDAFQFALDHFPASGEMTAERAQTLCELLGRQARMFIHVGQLAAARQALAAAEAHLPLVTDHGPHIAILGNMAITHFYAGDYERAIELTTQSLDLSRTKQDQEGIGFALNFLGSCAKARGEYEDARSYFQESVDVYQEMGDDLGMAMSLNNLGNVAQATGDYATAQKHYLTCSQLFQEHDYLHGAATTLSNAGKLARKQQDFIRARQLLEESLSLKRQLKDDRGTAVALVGLGDVLIATEKPAEAAALLQEALQLSHSSGDVKLLLEVVATMGRLALEQGEMTRAARLLAFVLANKATSQEVREPAEKGIEEFSEAVWQSATRWARQQTLDDLVAGLLEDTED